MDWRKLTERLGAKLETQLCFRDVSRVSGGCTDTAFKLVTDKLSCFVKTAPASALPRHRAEADGLRAIEATGFLRTPEVWFCGTILKSTSCLVLEWLNLGKGDARAWGAMGEGVAQLHGVKDTNFGWKRESYLGGTSQNNQPCGQWADFFCEQRLAPMLAALGKRGNGTPRAEILITTARKLLKAAPAKPCLIHGDLWSGNVAFLETGTPVVFDPASCFAVPEFDLGIARLFGGFPPPFYEAYEAQIPAADGWEARNELYELYHILNHALLFGGAYHTEAAERTARLCERYG